MALSDAETKALLSDLNFCIDLLEAKRHIIEAGGFGKIELDVKDGVITFANIQHRYRREGNRLL